MQQQLGRMVPIGGTVWQRLPCATALSCVISQRTMGYSAAVTFGMAKNQELEPPEFLLSLITTNFQHRRRSTFRCVFEALLQYTTWILYLRDAKLKDFLTRLVF